VVLVQDGEDPEMGYADVALFAASVEQEICRGTSRVPLGSPGKARQTLGSKTCGARAL
jgi:hypothetical protein